MPALPAAPGVAKIIVQQTLANVNVFNVLHAYGFNAAGYSQAELDSLASTFRTAWVSNVIPLQDGDLTLGSVLTQDLSTDIGLQGSATGTTPGTNVGSSISANAACCWSWKIANRYRGGHPRTYIGGLNLNALTNPNTLVASYVTSQLAAANAVRTAVNGLVVGADNWVLGCVSYYTAGALRPTPLFRAFTSVSVDNRVDSQRRRLGRDR